MPDPFFYSPARYVSDFAVLPAAAAQVGVAEYKKSDSVDMLGTPADGDVKFQDTDDDRTI